MSLLSSSSNELKKTKDINGDKSVASSLNSTVKKQFTNMTDQYNLYASTINKMEEKIKELKSIMLSDCFLKNCQNFTMTVKEEQPKTVSNKRKNTNTITQSTCAHVAIVDDICAGTGAGDGRGSDCESDKNIIISGGNDQMQIQQIQQEQCGKNNKESMRYFTPSQPNTLFWCFYIIYNGFSSYEYESNYFTAEQQFKIQTIEKVKRGEGKAGLKEHKISKTCFESGLMGCKNINAKTLYALCLCYNLNIFYIYKNTYYEMISSIDKPFHIVRYNVETNNYSICLPVDTGATKTLKEHSEYIENIKEKYWKLDNLEKPLRPVTVYSVYDLTTICLKLDIAVICESTNKKKTKAELYADILHKL